MVLAPEIAVSRWFNTSEPLTYLDCEAGRFFCMRSRCCVPAASLTERRRRNAPSTFSNIPISRSLDLHTVFEHHAAMSPVSLEAFIHEYRLTFPIGVDEAAEGVSIPITMGRYGMQGTPTSILIGRDGSIVHHGFGQQADMALGAIIAAQLAVTRG